MNQNMTEKEFQLMMTKLESCSEDVQFIESSDGYISIVNRHDKLMVENDYLKSFFKEFSERSMLTSLVRSKRISFIKLVIEMGVYDLPDEFGVTALEVACRKAIGSKDYKEIIKILIDKSLSINQIKWTSTMQEYNVFSLIVDLKDVELIKICLDDEIEPVVFTKEQNDFLDPILEEYNLKKIKK